MDDLRDLREFFTSPRVLDGATGTELERRGVPCPAPLWSASALLVTPAVVQQIHREYVAAGAEIVVANTFRTNPRTLRAAGLLGRGLMLNKLAISLARQAVGQGTSSRRVLVAASVAPVEDCYRPERVPAEAELREEHGLLADWLATIGPDLVWIETMGTVRELRVAAEAAAQRGLPFAASVMTREDGRLLGGGALEDAVAAVEPLAPLAIGLNCIPPRGVAPVLRRLRTLTQRPVAVYAHIGNPTPIRGWSHADQSGPAEYREFAREWLELGATIIGGCCGTGPEHVVEIRRVIDERYRGDL